MLLNDESARALPMRELVGRLARLAWEHKWAAAPALVITVGAQLFTLVSLTAQGLAIDVLRATADADAPPPEWPLGLAPPEGWGLTTNLWLLGGLTLVSGALVAGSRFGQRVADEHFVQRCVVDLRTRLYERLQGLSFSFFDLHESGAIIQRMTSDVQSVRMFIQGVMIRLLITLVTFAVFLVFMLQTHALLTLACLAVLPIEAWAMARYARISKPAFIEQGRKIDAYVHYVQESIGGVRVIRSFGREPERQVGADDRAAAARDHRLSIERFRAKYMPVTMGAKLLSSAVLVLFGGYLVLRGPAEGGILLGTLWIFRGLLDKLSAQTEAVAFVVASAPEALAGAERVFRLVDYPADVADRREPALPEGGIRGRVEFRDVWFGYDPERPVLRGIDFQVEPGETVAIVGPTGSGKSTLLSLIPRFYDPDRGQVVIDGVDSRDLPVRTYRRQVGVVFQEAFLFSNTIRHNVAFGEPEADEHDVLSALETACAVEVVEEKESGLHTVIGERGVSLSGGQRQRLTIARALMMRPPILILDDATGAVDPRTESIIQEALDRQRSGMTTFVVAHRLSTLRKADRVLVLENGELVDQGTHAELMGREGHYRAAALIQLALDEGEGDPESGAREGAPA